MQRCQEAPPFQSPVSVHNTHHLISVCRVGRLWHLILKKHKLKKKKALPTFACMIFEKQQKYYMTVISWKLLGNTHSLPSPYAMIAGFMSNCSEVWAGAGRLSWSPDHCWTLLCLPRPSSWAGMGSTCSPGGDGVLMVWQVSDLQAAVRLSRLRCGIRAMALSYDQR